MRLPFSDGPVVIKREPVVHLGWGVCFHRREPLCAPEMLDLAEPWIRSHASEQHGEAILACLHTPRLRLRYACLPDGADRFHRGLPSGTSLFLKKGFEFGEVTAWRDGLRAGDRVRLTEDEIFNWMLAHQDGRREGGFTTAALQE